jgi:hypothetical protein
MVNDIFSWQQDGSISLWIESPVESQQKVVLSGDRKGFLSFAALLNLMIKNNRNCQRSLKLTTSLESLAINNDIDNPAKFESRLTIFFESEEVVDFVVKPYGNSMDLVFSSYSASSFRKCLLDGLKNNGQKRFGFGSNEMWITSW